MSQSDNCKDVIFGLLPHIAIFWNVFWTIYNWINYLVSYILKVIPPPEWSSNSESIKNNFVLKEVGSLNCESLLLGGKEVFYTEFDQMSYRDFMAYSTEKEKVYIDKSLEELEDIFWKSEIAKPKKYAINNEMSLFGDDVDIWNLSKFTNFQSNIHATHYYRNVRFFSKHSFF